ncbi:MAG: hypothetical protein HYV60_16520 [Planctomycetia bacterium]|nr:hypothetical protein [Planctomycetia bacterium]
MANSTSLLWAAALVFSLSGCNTPSSGPALSGQAIDAHTDHGDHAEHGASGQTDMERMKAELAKLSPQDAASAEKQHMCPVSGEMLGAMGAPQKVDVNGRNVWICCDGCKDQLLEKPDEYLAKLRQE